MCSHKISAKVHILLSIEAHCISLHAECVWDSHKHMGASQVHMQLRLSTYMGHSNVARDHIIVTDYRGFEVA